MSVRRFEVAQRIAFAAKALARREGPVMHMTTQGIVLVLATSMALSSGGLSVARPGYEEALLGQRHFVEQGARS
jgi:hypothetical protein